MCRFVLSVSHRAVNQGVRTTTSRLAACLLGRLFTQALAKPSSGSGQVISKWSL